MSYNFFLPQSLTILLYLKQSTISDTLKYGVRLVYLSKRYTKLEASNIDALFINDWFQKPFESVCWESTRINEWEKGRGTVLSQKTIACGLAR